ncbi:MAG: hypothetical protein JO291_06350, partial [Acidimicrobiia bacterium]|nr:hypothetical protein [Acidimicrobiia bacterium]
RFQIIWVIGALLGLIAFPLWVGFLLVALGAGIAAFLYGIGSLAWRHRTGAQRSKATETAVVIDDRINEVQEAAKRGLRRSGRRIWNRILERDAAGQPVAVPAPPAPPASPVDTDIDAPVHWADDEPTTLGPFPPPPPDRVDRPN